MKLKNILFISLIVINTVAYAESATQQPPVSSSQPIAWTTDNASDRVTVENGNSANLSIVINVNDDGSTDPAGINVLNCGETTHINAGSSAVCISSDPKNPISFTSDKEYPATGTYQITQQLPKK